MKNKLSFFALFTLILLVYSIPSALSVEQEQASPSDNQEGIQREPLTEEERERFFQERQEKIRKAMEEQRLRKEFESWDKVEPEEAKTPDSTQPETEEVLSDEADQN